MRILVTGGSGLLGANLVLEAVAAGHEAVSTFHRHPVLIPGTLATERIDLPSDGALSRLIDTYRPECIIHCAADTNVDWCEDHPEEARMLNVEGARVVAEAANRAGISLVHVSTDGIFGTGNGPYDEAASPDPVNEYARTKLEAEDVIRGTVEGCVIARGSFYGWNAQPKLGLAEWALREFESGNEVAGFTDVRFNPLLANDFSRVILALLENSREGVFHLGSSDACSKYEFILMLAEEWELDTEVVSPRSISQIHLRAPRPLDTVLNVGKVERALGTTMKTVREGLRLLRDQERGGRRSALRSCFGQEVRDDAKV